MQAGAALRIRKVASGGRRLSIVAAVMLAAFCCLATQQASAHGRTRAAKPAHKHRKRCHRKRHKKGHKGHRWARPKHRHRCGKRHKHRRHHTPAPPSSPAPAPTAPGKVVFQCGVNLCAVDGSGGNRRQLTADGGSAGKQYLEPSVSRDGTRMIFQGQDSQAYTADGNAQNVHALTDGSLPAQLPEISPDGSRVLWTTTSTFAGTFTVVENFDGSNDQAMQVPNGVAGFAPGGQLFCDVNPSDLRISNQAAATLTDSCPHVVASDSAPDAYFDWRPQFSPDGSLVADAVGHDGGLSDDGIYLYSAASGQLVRRLTTGADSAPVFSPDGATILFDRGDDIYSVPTAGGTPTLFIAAGSHPSWSN